MKAYKGFNKDMTCRGFQYEEGKKYETGQAIQCKTGFHACEMPLDCFAYYKPSESIYHEVEQDGEISRGNDDTKIASTKIKIGAELSIGDMVKAQIDFVLEKIKKSKKKSETDKEFETAATSGDWSSAATSGDWSSAATSGEESSAATDNKNAIALACGKNAKAKGVIGSYIVLTEWNNNQTEMISAKMVRITGKKYKADTWYVLKDGKVVEWEDEENET